MDNRIKELVAIGASITANCQPCLKFHIGKAREYGVDDKEIADAIDVGKMVIKGAAGKMDKFTETILGGEPAGAAAESEGCGCS